METSLSVLRGEEYELRELRLKLLTGSSPQGNLQVLANENVDITASKNLSLNGKKQSSKLLTTGLLTLDGKLGMQILSPIIKGTSGATNPRKQPGQIR